MKKVTLNGEGEVKMLLRGVRHSHTAVEVTINNKGIVVDDKDAELIQDRLGSQVTVAKAAGKDLESAAKSAIQTERENAGGGDGGGDKVPEPSDAVKKLAADNGIDLATVKGTGAKGNIVKKDVEDAIAAAKAD